MKKLEDRLADEFIKQVVDNLFRGYEYTDDEGYTKRIVPKMDEFVIDILQTYHEDIKEELFKRVDWDKLAKDLYNLMLEKMRENPKGFVSYSGQETLERKVEEMIRETNIKDRNKWFIKLIKLVEETDDK